MSWIGGKADELHGDKSAVKVTSLRGTLRSPVTLLAYIVSSEYVILIS